MLSIIIPAYNVNNYIEQCIESLLPLQNVEILLIDDGSPEDLTFVKEKYKKYSYFHYYKKENGGLSDARNYGLKKATTEYVMFLDGDDFVDTEALAKSIEYIKETKYTAYYMNYAEYYGISNIVYLEKNRTYSQKDFISVKDETFKKEFLPIIACRYIIKRNHLISNHLFFKKGIYQEDEEWTPKFLISVDKIYNLHQHVLYYRQRENSIMSTINYKHITDLFKIMDSLISCRETLLDRMEIQFIDERLRILYRDTVKLVLNLEMSVEEKEYAIEQLDNYRKTIFLVNNKKNVIYKYCPVRVLLKLLYTRRRK